MIMLASSFNNSRTRFVSTITLNRKNSIKKIEKPFDKILIANRGEIACRVIRSAHKLGVATVAVYSDADFKNSMHVRQATEARYLGGNMSKDSYLRMDRLIQIAKDTGAQAIHPGYGFLSENPKFVDMVEAAGLKFIGPSSGPMLAMGDKINSKIIAKKAGVNVIPGFDGEVPDADTAVQLARDVVGYPVMLKASAGGGGKGMRVAYTDDEVREGFLLSKSEAMSSFGDDRMLIERFIENPHHIEIQVLADTHGNVVAFPERECSVQRRNQKVVEESPSCLLTPATRQQMQMQAIQLCKATGYRSAGTVEMLADDHQNFYFLEMNTRLQVEHPITELVSGEDLVEHMLWVAAGKPLPERLVKQQCLPFKGAAIESRVYAEDPLRNFLPSIGPLLTYREPQQFSPSSPSVHKQSKKGSGTVRIDTGVFEGSNISMFYDPMIAKLCTHADTRAEAIALMEDALDKYVIQGLGNNITFLRSVYGNETFRSGNYSTKFISTEYPEPHGFKGVTLSWEENLRMVAVAAAMHQVRSAPDDIRKTVSPPEVVDVDAVVPEADAEDDDVDYNRVESNYVIGLGPRDYRVRLSVGRILVAFIAELKSDGSQTEEMVEVTLSDLVWHSQQPLALAVFHKHSTDSQVKEVVQFLGTAHSAYPGVSGFRIRYQGCEQLVRGRSEKEFQLEKFMLPAEEGKDSSKYLLSPMPGTLLSLSVEAGQKVETGQQIAVVEAMKMQNVLRAPKSGVVKALPRKVGSHLKVDDVIAEFD